MQPGQTSTDVDYLNTTVSDIRDPNLSPVLDQLVYAAAVGVKELATPTGDTDTDAINMARLRVVVLVLGDAAPAAVLSELAELMELFDDDTPAAPAAQPPADPLGGLLNSPPPTAGQASQPAPAGQPQQAPPPPTANSNPTHPPVQPPRQKPSNKRGRRV